MSAIRQSVDLSGNWTTYDYDGSVLSTAADLQPGINRAVATGYPLEVCGRRNAPITLTATTLIPPTHGAHMTFKNVYLNSSVWPVLDVDTQYESFIDWQSGEINYTGAAASWPSSVVRISPRNAIPNPGPDEPSPIHKFSTLNLPKINNRGAVISNVVTFEAGANGIVNNKFNFMHVNASAATRNGLVAINPTGGPQSAFVQNEINFGLVDAFLDVGIFEGNGATNQCIGTNRWVGAVTSSVPNAIAYFMEFGVMSHAEFTSLSQNGAGPSTGILFGTSAQGNWVLAPQIQATTPIVNQGTNNKLVTPPY